MKKTNSIKSYNRSLFTLLTGSIAAQALPIIASPALTRIYSPEDIGILAIYVSIITIIGSIITGKYEIAIINEEKEEDSITLLLVSFIFLIIMSVMYAILIIIFHHSLIKLLGIPELSLWLYLSPVVVFFIGLFNILTHVNIRKENYKIISQSTFYKSAIAVTIQLLFGLINSSVNILVSGQFFSYMISNINLAKSILVDRIKIRRTRTSDIWHLMKQNKKFPLYTAPGIFVNGFSQNVNNFYISFSFNTTQLGYYSMVQRTLGLPLTIMSSAFSQIFMKEANKEKAEVGKCLNTFIYTFKRLCIISIILFIIVYLIIDSVVIFAFGEKWILVAQYIKILSPLFAIKFVSSTLSVIMNICNKQKEFFAINVLVFLVTFSTIMLSYYINSSFVELLIYQNVTLSLVYSCLLIRYYFVAKKTNEVLR